MIYNVSRMLFRHVLHFFDASRNTKPLPRSVRAEQNYLAATCESIQSSFGPEITAKQLNRHQILLKSMIQRDIGACLEHETLYTRLLDRSVGTEDLDLF